MNGEHSLLVSALRGLGAKVSVHPTGTLILEVHSGTYIQVMRYEEHYRVITFKDNEVYKDRNYVYYDIVALFDDVATEVQFFRG